MKKDVNQIKPNLTFPSCPMVLEWTGSEQPQRLCHKVALKGAKPPAYSHILHDPQDVGKCKSLSVFILL